MAWGERKGGQGGAPATLSSRRMHAMAKWYHLPTKEG